MEERKLLLMPETDHLRLFFDLMSLGVKVTSMVVAPIVETATGNKVTDALEVTGEAQTDLWNAVCEAMKLTEIKGYWM